MEQIITIYQGNDPREKARIQDALKNSSITFYDSICPALNRLQFDSQETAYNRTRLLISPPLLRSAYYEKLCQTKGYRPQGFEIKTLEKDESAARKVLSDLKLSRKQTKKNPSFSDKFNDAFQKAALPTGVYLALATAVLMIAFVIYQFIS